MMRFAGCFLFVLSVVLVSQTQAQTKMKLTLDECIQTALSNNATIEQDKYSVAIAETNVDNVRNQFLPNSSAVSWSMSRSVQGPREGSVLDPTTGALVQTLGEDRVSGGQSFGIGGLSIPIYDGGLIASLAAQKKSLQSTQMTQIGNRGDVIFSVKQRYYQLLQAMELLEVQQERVGVSEESLRRSETLYEIGSAAILQVANARSTLANAKVALIRLENSVLISRSNLAFAMGLGTDVDVVPAEDEAFVLRQPKYKYEQAVTFALDEHPDILASKYNMLASKDNYRATKYDLYHPTVGLRASGYNWSIGQDENFGGVEDLFLKNYSYSVSVSVSMTLFNFNTTNNLKRQKLQYLRSQEALDQTKRIKAVAIKQAYLNLEQYRRSIEANEIAVQASEENFKLEEERYNFGGGTFLQRLDAQRQLFEARNNLVQAQYNYLIEVARLENELGISPVGEE
ncbi:MAG: TolC family protein [Candidatus Latescibacteria bacterium]|jgi:outer membrane protein|nr:TolC family protein [Candidatus Latescibacterota bacterium]MBT4137401.1 TolC family protein [Candidatus Latescibacterota bacterium]